MFLQKKQTYVLPHASEIRDSKSATILAEGQWS
jgi:hypothetical protein